MKLFIASVLVVMLGSVLGGECPQELCDITETCCHKPGASWYGCCPVPNAVCCTDGLHCCPPNTVCKLPAGTCEDQNKLIPQIFRKKVFPPIEKPKAAPLAVANKVEINKLIPQIFRKRVFPPIEKPKAAPLAVANKVEIIYCPGGYYYCPDGNTCCLLPTGQYGCCPYPAAICCADHVHCCPSGTHCDSTSQYCLQGSNRFTALFKQPALPMN